MLGSTVSQILAISEVDILHLYLATCLATRFKTVLSFPSKGLCGSMTTSYRNIVQLDEVKTIEHDIYVMLKQKADKNIA